MFFTNHEENQNIFLEKIDILFFILWSFFLKNPNYPLHFFVLVQDAFVQGVVLPNMRDALLTMSATYILTVCCTRRFHVTYAQCLDDINNGSQHTLHWRHLICQCSSITPHRGTTPQDAAFNEEFNAWQEKSTACEAARAKRRAEKKASNKRHKGLLVKAGPMPRHRQRAEMVRS